MIKYNHTKYAILGVLTTGCRTGYSIKQMIDQSLNHFWKISYGQIYPTLKQLVTEGLVTVQYTQQVGKPDKKEYFLTEHGKGALQQWLEAPIMEIPVERNEVLLKLFFSRHQSPIVTLQQLESYKSILDERYRIYQGIESSIRNHGSNSPDAKYWLFTLDYGKSVTQAASDWCTRTIENLKEN